MLRHSFASLLQPQRLQSARYVQDCAGQLSLGSGPSLGSESASTAALLRRLLSTDGNATEKPTAEPEQPFVEEYPPYDVSYVGSFCSAHSILKRASLLNTFASVSASPLVLMYAEMGLVGRVGLAITLSGFGLLTTGALHWFTKPYVHQLRYNGSNGDIIVKTVDIFARLRSQRFHIKDVTFPTALHPAVTFMAKGKPYFIEKNIFPDEHLLQLLTPEDPALANAPRIKDDEDD